MQVSGQNGNLDMRGSADVVSAGKDVKIPGYERTASQTAGMELNDAGLTLNQGYHTSEKFGDEHISVEATEDISTSVSTDGTIKSSVEAGGKIETENLEVGAKAAASSKSTENSEENSMGMEASAGMKIADGMKMNNSVNMQSAEKFSETEEAYTQEGTESISFQSRIEVDPKEATAGKKLAAGIYNTGMKAAETGVNSMLSSSSKTEILKQCEEAAEREENQEQEAEKSEETGEEEGEAAEESNGEGYDYYYGMGY